MLSQCWKWSKILKDIDSIEGYLIWIDKSSQIPHKIDTFQWWSVANQTHFKINFLMNLFDLIACRVTDIPLGRVITLCLLLNDMMTWKKSTNVHEIWFKVFVTYVDQNRLEHTHGTYFDHILPGIWAWISIYILLFYGVWLLIHALTFNDFGLMEAFVVNLTIIGSDNGLSPDRCQAIIIGTIGGISLIGP